MKKFLLIIAPLFVTPFILIWLSEEFKGLLGILSDILFTTIFAIGFLKWIDFVDRHIEDDL